jgi:hypothetical protein
MRVFSNKGEDLAQVNINKILNIDNESKPLPGFFEPLTTIIFKPGTT